MFKTVQIEHPVKCSTVCDQQMEYLPTKKGFGIDLDQVFLKLLKFINRGPRTRQNSYH